MGLNTRIWATLLISFIGSCSQSRESNIQFQDIEGLLSDLEAGRTTIWKVERETLANAVFMDTEIKERIDLIEPKFLLNLDMSSYKRDERDKLAVKLHDSYQNITSVLTRSDKNLSSIFRDNFEVIDPMKMIDGPVLIYRNKAFVTFYDSTFTLELKEPDTVIVTIVWLLTE